MEAWKGARFVGLYACFPIEKSGRQIDILTQILKLEPTLDFNRMKFGLLAKGFQEAQFSQKQLSEGLKSLEAGEADWLQLHYTSSTKDWVSSYNDHVDVAWESSITVLNNRSPSPIDKRFGDTGSIVVTYPISRFQTDLESPFQKSLLTLARSLCLRHQIYWAFVHEGLRPKRPASVVEDDIFQKTRDAFPRTSFDSDLHISRFFKEVVKGAFWANFLNSFHVQKLGGIQRIKDERPCSLIEEVGNGHVLLQVGPSPLPTNCDKALIEYQCLRTFLKPILLETPEERTKFQRDILGSWRPPGVDADWNMVPPRTSK